MIDINLRNDIRIMLVTKEFENAAKTLVLEGLEERFGVLDTSYNEDLNNIITTYIDNGNVFLIGLHNNGVVCTGALTLEDKRTGRIERMSVKKAYRRCGIAKLMLNRLENAAREKEYTELRLETNSEWTSAIQFYINNGFQQDYKDDRRTHFTKTL